VCGLEFCGVEILSKKGKESIFKKIIDWPNVAGIPVSRLKWAITGIKLIDVTPILPQISPDKRPINPTVISFSEDLNGFLLRKSPYPLMQSLEYKSFATFRHFAQNFFTGCQSFETTFKT